MKEVRNVHLVYFSPCGGTAKVAKALARDIDLPVTEHDVTLPASRERTRAFGEGDLVFIAFPVYGGRAPRNVEAVFSCLEGGGAACVPVAVYGNRAFEGALIDLHAQAKARGFAPAAAVAAVAEHSLAPMIASGRPDAEDAEKLAAYGLAILAAAREGAYLAEGPGAMPEWKSPPGTSFFPVTDESRCSLCGRCVAVCPTGAANAQSPADVDTSKCIVCAACAKYCPEKARAGGNPETREKFRPHLAAAAASRKEPELFPGTTACSFSR